MTLYRKNNFSGSLWHPNTYSGRTLVIVSLIFSLLIYNSYSAFITSILSVKVEYIKSINDLLDSDYGIGYTRNSQDEFFLRVNICLISYKTEKILKCLFV